MTRSTSVTAAKREEQRPILERLLDFALPASGGDGHPIHLLHPYPAKYIPELPREILLEHTNERHVVLDPFCGSGTTLVEAALLGRKSIGIDANPIAALISRAKTSPLTAEEQSLARGVLAQARLVDPLSLPSFKEHVIERQEHWFQANMLRELAWIRGHVDAQKSESLATFLACVFSSVITSASRQDGETRYAAVDKAQPDGYALGRFVRKLETALNAIGDFSKDDRAKRNVPRVIHASTQDVGPKLIPDRTVDLVVTSPPYPNSFDYYLYHKLRMAWLGHSYQEAQQVEIGSRYEHSSRRAPIEVFVSRMTPVMHNVARMLKPSKLAYFFVGDAVIGGSYVDMSRLYCDLGRAVGLKLVAETEYDLATISRSFQGTRGSAGNSHRHKKFQRVLVFERQRLRGESPGRRRAKATPLAMRPIVPLGATIKDGDVVALASDDSDRHIHSLGYFPSKFIPEVPRWAIREYTAVGETILDPFAGSGTSAVEAKLAGRASVSVDISPYACLLASAKTSPVDEPALRAAEARLLAVSAGSSGLKRASRLKFDLDSFWFSRQHLSEFAQLKAVVDAEFPEHVQPFFQAFLGSLVRHFSYQDPGQIKVKRDAKKILHGTPSPFQLVPKKLPVAVNRLLEFQQRSTGELPAEVVCSSADAYAAAQVEAGSRVDAIITSPPYINAMNYAMATRYELLLLGLVDPSSLKQHQTEYFGTERVYARDFKTLKQVPADWKIADYLNPRLAAVYAREPKRAYVAYSYFVQMERTLRLLARMLKPGGRFVLVAGTNRIREVPIDTFGVLTALLEDSGLTRERVFHYEIIKQMFKITRHKTGAVIPTDGVAVLSA